MLQTLQLPVSVQNEYNLLAEISMILTSLDCLSDRLKEELAMGCISTQHHYVLCYRLACP